LPGGRFHIKREFLDDIAEHRLMSQIAKLHKALLVMHSPTDDTVGIDNATHIFVAAKHPKSFVSLAGSDHLLTASATRPMSPTSSPPGPNAISSPSVRSQPLQRARRRATSWCAKPRNSKFQQTCQHGPAPDAGG
jgi:putative redox protein